MATGRRTVRIFVSAILDDMDAERECLHRRVLPELRHRCEQVGIAIELIDPLWPSGRRTIAEDLARLTATLKEVDSCRPFFVGVLGNRYGRPLQLPAEVIEADPWLASHPDRSQLALEIARAAFDPVGGKPFGTFYFRSTDSLGPASEHLRHYLPADREEAERLEELKRSVRATGLSVAEYQNLSLWHHSSDGRLAGLGEFTERIIDDLWCAIEAYSLTAGTKVDSPAGEVPFLDEGVEFTVYRPRTVRPREWHRLLAFAHLCELPADAPEGQADPAEEVGRQAAQVLGEQLGKYKATTEQSRLAVPRWGEVRLVPHLPGFLVNPPQQSFLWLESVHRAEFRIQAAPEMDGKMARGYLSAFLGDILMAEVALAIRVDSQPTGPAATTERSTARTFRKIFASYSHKDLAIVEQFARYSEALGDTFLRDWTHLRAGECWSERLEQMIREADVFQLFWSRNAMASPFVEREWRLALSMGRPRFVRPCYWEDPLPASPERDLPPEELSRLHFQRLAGDLLPSLPCDRPADHPPPGTHEMHRGQAGLRRAWAGARASVNEGFGRALDALTGATASLFRRRHTTEERLDQLVSRRRDDFAKDLELSDGPSRRLVLRAAPILSRPLWPRSKPRLDALRLELYKAGFRAEHAVQVYLSARFLALLLALPVALPLAYWRWGITPTGVAWMALATAIAFSVPGAVLVWIGKSRARAVARELPDALDVLVVLVEAGLGFDAAIRHLAREPVGSCPILCGELTIASFELQMGVPRRVVLQELARRTGVDDVKDLAAVFIEADRSDTGIEMALREQSALMRGKRGRIAPRMAARLARVLRFPSASRHERLRAQLPGALERMATVLRSGESFSRALRAVVGEGPPIGMEFAACLDLMELGLPVEEAVRKMAQSAGPFEYWLLYHAVLIQRRTGADLAVLLDSLARIVLGRLGADTSRVSATPEDRT